MELRAARMPQAMERAVLDPRCQHRGLEEPVVEVARERRIVALTGRAAVRTWHDDQPE
jgi:hypothetical protein